MTKRFRSRPCDVPELKGYTAAGYYRKMQYIPLWYFARSETAAKFCQLRNEGHSEIEAMRYVLMRECTA